MNILWSQIVHYCREPEVLNITDGDRTQHEAGTKLVFGAHRPESTNPPNLWQEPSGLALNLHHRISLDPAQTPSLPISVIGTNKRCLLSESNPINKRADCSGSVIRRAPKTLEAGQRVYSSKLFLAGYRLAMILKGPARKTIMARYMK
jgi:hypothetical protein